MVSREDRSCLSCRCERIPSIEHSLHSRRNDADREAAAGHRAGQDYFSQYIYRKVALLTEGAIGGWQPDCNDGIVISPVIYSLGGFGSQRRRASMHRVVSPPPRPVRPSVRVRPPASEGTSLGAGAAAAAPAPPPREGLHEVSPKMWLRTFSTFMTDNE